MKPEDRILAYLNAHKDGYALSTIDQVVQEVKLFVFYGMSPLSDDDIRKVVGQWAMFNSVGMLLSPSITNPPGSPSPGNPSAPSNSDLVDAIKKVITTVAAGVTIGPKGANVNIAVTGLTANLKRRNLSLSLGLSLGQTLELKVESGPFHFTGDIATDKWEITLSYPRDSYTPNLITAPKVFAEGEKAILSIANAITGLSSISDLRNVSALIHPNVSAVSDAVDALTGIAETPKKGGSSFGFKLGSPPSVPGQQGIPPGIQGTVIWSWEW